jgi:hypothetical protein
MPEISRFLGIVVRMYYNEHGTPHLHAVYGKHEVSVDVETLEVRGSLPRRALRHVLDWVRLHEAELLDNWMRARRGEPLNPIEPLE